MAKFVKPIFIVLLVMNFVYLMKIYSQERNQIPKKLNLNDKIAYSEHTAYDALNSTEKVSYLLDLVEHDKSRFWLSSTEMTEPELKVDVADFVRGFDEDGVIRNNWCNKPTVFYDPRFTLAVYLDEIRNQLAGVHGTANGTANGTVNGTNNTANGIPTVPFDWSDWVDLTLLNDELAKPIDDRLDCKWLQAKVNKPTKYPEFCTNLRDISKQELLETQLPKEYLPGFVVKTSPMNKAPHMQVMMQGKAHLLAYQPPPLSIIFLTLNGTYEAQVNGKQRIVHGNMFENYLARRGMQHQESVELNPIREFRQLVQTIPPTIVEPGQGPLKQVDPTKNEFVLDPKSFHYQEPQIHKQIKEYDQRFQLLEDAMTNELHYNSSIIEDNKLTRQELVHYNSLKYASSIKVSGESTYYKLATLMKVNGNKDAGWHYEWRFFNGALRHKKEGWTTQQLEIREKIILDRLLRNWFRFAKNKGIVSWIAHGPLLSWYWNGLMFPYDIDIDIQMPSSELNRLAKFYNQSLVVEEIEEGFGKYFIDCSTFLHHRDKAVKDNYIDARFIDIDTGTYIDITGIGKNNEQLPLEYKSYVRNKVNSGEEVELYMDRRKHWLTFEQINPLHYSMISGVPTFIPNDIMTMLNKEYQKGTKLYYYQGYYFVPILRLWLQEKDLKPVLKGRKLSNLKQYQVIDLLQNLTEKDKVKLLENDEILSEYYLTYEYTKLHELEKEYMFDERRQYSIELKQGYDELMLRFEMGKPLRKSLFNYEYLERFRDTFE